MYPQTLSIQSQRPFQRNQNRVRHEWSNRRLGPVSNIVIVAMLLSVLGLIYLTQINKTNAFTYPMNELKTKQSQLADEQQALQTQTARLQSLDRLKNSSVAKSYTAPTEVSYLK